jgi:hypothetical protein
MNLGSSVSSCQFSGPHCALATPSGVCLVDLTSSSGVRALNESKHHYLGEGIDAVDGDVDDDDDDCYELPYAALTDAQTKAAPASASTANSSWAGSIVAFDAYEYAHTPSTSTSTSPLPSRTVYAYRQRRPALFKIAFDA